MKTLKEQIIKIVIDNTSYVGQKKEDIQEDAEGIASEIESLIKENYVEKEFVKWIIIEFRAGRITYYDSDNTYSIWNIDIDIDYTLDELYDYWLKEIKK